MNNFWQGYKIPVTVGIIAVCVVCVFVLIYKMTAANAGAAKTSSISGLLSSLVGRNYDNLTPSNTDISGMASSYYTYMTALAASEDSDDESDE